jgi:hypothetical protein
VLSRNAAFVLIVGANLAVGIAFVAQRGWFDGPRPKVVHVVDLAAYSEYAVREPKACLAEYAGEWVMVGGTVIDINRVEYDVAETWYVRLAATSEEGRQLTTLELDGSQAGKLKRLKRGDPITVIGRVASLQMIDRCQVVG